MFNWDLIANYPAWPDPWFTQFDKAARGRIVHSFRPFLPSPRNVSAETIINLHRLKRLYIGPGGTRTNAAAQLLLSDVQRLRERGARIVWTMHNPYPIDGGPVTSVDIDLTRALLEVVDLVLVHTRADGEGARELGRGNLPVEVMGWAGMPSVMHSSSPAPAVAHVIEEMTATRFPILLVSNWTSYRDIPGVIMAGSQVPELDIFILGTFSQDSPREAIQAAIEAAPSNVHVTNQWVDPKDLFWLFRAARASICNYDTRGDHWFFRHLLHPSSVSAAITFGVPIIAPKLAGVAEISSGYPRALFPVDGSIAEGLHLAARYLQAGEWEDKRPTFTTSVDDDRRRWARILDAYVDVEHKFDASHR